MLSDLARGRWRERIQAAHGWMCSWCKTSLAVQASLELKPHCEVITHSACGHVLFWRSGTTASVLEYLTPRRHARPRPRRRKKAA